jgi:hypothetical protein
VLWQLLMKQIPHIILIIHLFIAVVVVVVVGGGVGLTSPGTAATSGLLYSPR